MGEPATRTYRSYHSLSPSGRRGAYLTMPLRTGLSANIHHQPTHSEAREGESPQRACTNATRTETLHFALPWGGRGTRAARAALL